MHVRHMNWNEILPLQTEEKKPFVPSLLNMFDRIKSQFEVVEDMDYLGRSVIFVV
jgi:hypothetical protein